MKRFYSFGLLALFLFAGLVEAQELRPISFGNNVGSARSDSMIWFGSGSGIPGSDNRVDTMVAGAQNDTTYGVDVSGAAQVAISLIGRSKNDDQDLTYSAQVSNTNDVDGAWHTLNVTYSVDVTAGSAVGQSANTGRDTTMWLLLNNTVPDTMFTAQTGVTAATHGDQAYVRSNRFVRLIFDPGSAAGDSVYISAVITRVYPR